MPNTIGTRADAPRAAPGPQAQAKVKARQQIAARVVDIESNACERKSRFHIPCALPSRAFLIAMLYAGFLLATPVCLTYVDIDYSSNLARGLLIGGSAVLALTVAHAGTTAAWYNMILLFHTGVEVKIADVAITFARASGTETVDLVLASVGAGVVILHLIPFFLSDMSALLVVLAMAGVVVNTSIVVFLESSLLLLVLATSIALLVLTLIVSASGIKASMLSQIYCSLCA